MTLAAIVTRETICDRSAAMRYECYSRQQWPRGWMSNGVFCAAVGCSISRRDNPKLSFFRIPKE